MGGDRSSSSSSGEDDGDADWKAAIDSVAATTTFSGSSGNGVVTTSNGSAITFSGHQNPDDQPYKNEPQKLKHYQIKALKLLDDMLEKEIEIVKDPTPVTDTDTVKNEGGVRLFKDAPRGILFDHVDELEGPKRRPRLLPGKEIDEKSKKFKCQIESVAIEGTDILAAATDSYKRTLSKIEAKDAAAKAAAKREEERVLELKKIRGERWLPSIAKYMKAFMLIEECYTKETSDRTWFYVEH